MSVNSFSTSRLSVRSASYGGGNVRYTDARLRHIARGPDRHRDAVYDGVEMIEVDAYPLCWPVGFERVDAWRRNTTPFNTGFARARDNLINEIRLLRGNNVVLSTNIELRRDGLPYANQRQPEDGGVAVYFIYKGDQYTFACDKYRRVEHNVHAIGKTIGAIRGIERWGASDMLKRAFSGFKTLPQGTSTDPYSILGIQELSSAAEIKSAYRQRARDTHPDHGGNEDDFKRVSVAYAELQQRGVVP